MQTWSLKYNQQQLNYLQHELPSYFGTPKTAEDSHPDKTKQTRVPKVSPLQKDQEHSSPQRWYLLQPDSLYPLRLNKWKHDLRSILPVSLRHHQTRRNSGRIQWEYERIICQVHHCRPNQQYSATKRQIIGFNQVLNDPEVRFHHSKPDEV